MRAVRRSLLAVLLSGRPVRLSPLLALRVAAGQIPRFPRLPLHGPRVALSLPLRSERVQGIRSLPLPLFVPLSPGDNWAGKEEPVRTRVCESGGFAVCPQGSAFGGPRGDVRL